jgi:hypothetical protein
VLAKASAFCSHVRSENSNVSPPAGPKIEIRERAALLGADGQDVPRRPRSESHSGTRRLGSVAEASGWVETSPIE